MTRLTRLLLSLALVLVAGGAAAQGTRDDYRRAERFLPESIKQLAYDGVVTPHWIGKTSRFWYLKEGPAGKEFVLIDAASATREPAFDHAKLAAPCGRNGRRPTAGSSRSWKTTTCGCVWSPPASA
jgi:hypothetical protein